MMAELQALLAAMTQLTQALSQQNQRAAAAAQSPGLMGNQLRQHVESTHARVGIVEAGSRSQRLGLPGEAFHPSSEYPCLLRKSKNCVFRGFKRNFHDSGRAVRVVLEAPSSMFDADSQYHVFRDICSVCGYVLSCCICALAFVCLLSS